MALSMEEPTAITLQSAETPGVTQAITHVKITVPAPAKGKANVRRFPLKLKRSIIQDSTYIESKDFLLNGTIPKTTRPDYADPQRSDALERWGSESGNARLKGILLAAGSS